MHRTGKELIKNNKQKLQKQRRKYNKNKRTRGSVYKILNYTLINISNNFQINPQQQACRTGKYENAQAVTIEFSRRQKREPSTLKT